MIITINGKPGSGKTSVSKLLAEKLNMKRYYIGGMRREAARDKGMTLQEYNAWSETHPQGDKEFDEYLTELGKREDNFIIESRTAFHFIPHSIKILLDVDMDTAAARIFKDVKITDRNETADTASVESIKRSLTERLKSDRLRYKKYYSLDVYDSSHFDFVLDTTNISVQETYDQIIAFLKTQGSLPAKT